MSVLDSRQLVFDETALRASMSPENRVAKMLKLPCGPDDSIYLLPDQQCLEVLHDQKHRGDAVIHRLSAQQVAALLIAYCIRAGIPVPRNCKKSIIIHPSHVALTFASRIAAPA